MFIKFLPIIFDNPSLSFYRATFVTSFNYFQSFLRNNYDINQYLSTIFNNNRSATINFKSWVRIIIIKNVTNFNTKFQLTSSSKNITFFLHAHKIPSSLASIQIGFLRRIEYHRRRDVAFLVHFTFFTACLSVACRATFPNSPEIYPSRNSISRYLSLRTSNPAVGRKRIQYTRVNIYSPVSDPIKF